ncbi:transglycosylase SLT domain-containing protein [Streptomyces sp. NBC_01190]|uniref:transglycosylase SLT domain-containing protein n=1 Tax=Streptomyces sp. NBC_01190 TaxID=2903767 RepID=UPI0038669639|nr:transglycosylase SLT domain-containing protein [Streptomyces sp. NBC_01190]
MQLPTIPKIGSLSKKKKITVAGAGAATAVVLAVTGFQATGGSTTAASAQPAATSASAAQHAKTSDAKADTAAEKAPAKARTATPHAAEKAAPKPAAPKTTPARPAPPKPAPPKPAAPKPVAPKHVAPKPAAPKPAPKPVAPRAAVTQPTHRVVLKAKAPAPAPRPAPVAAKPVYANNLDGWIRQSLDIMHQKGIPGSYNGIYRNIIRESSGNPNAINLWDINAQNGIPSKGLLQVIPPTFATYHVSGTSWNIYDPVANITAACNYAADRYGSMDNVYSAY